MPISTPWCVPVLIHSCTSRAPSTVYELTVMRRSGNAVKYARTASCSAGRPWSGIPSATSRQITSSATSATAPSASPRFQAASARSARASICRLVMDRR
jgi:hypothetical protein